LATNEAAEVIEVAATTEVRRAIAEEMGVPQSAEMADLQCDRGDIVIWAIAARLRASLRSSTEPSQVELESLIWHTYRRVFGRSFGGRRSVKGDGTLAPRRLERVIAYIESNLTNPRLSLAAIAQTAALSPFHFLRCFERTLHMTPHQFVRARRLERIRAAVAKGQNVLDAARQHGFRHLNHFRSVYLHHHGLPAGQEVAVGHSPDLAAVGDRR
jgi:AraC-like DNA-binding protein